MLTRAWKTHCDTHTQKLVLLALADNATEDDGSAWPSLRTLARKCDLSEKGVCLQLKALKEKNLIRITHRKDPKYGDTSNLYHLTLPYEYRSVPPLNAVHPPSERRSPSRLNAVHTNRQYEPSDEPSGGNPGPKPFRSRLVEIVESSKKERERLVMKFALDNSISGRRWMNKQAELDYTALGKAMKDAQTKLNKGEYIP